MTKSMDEKTNFATVGFWGYKSARLYFSLLLALICLAFSSMQNTLSMAMVCMVSATTSNDSDNQLVVQSSSHYSNESNSSVCGSVQDLQQDYKGEFSWGKFEQGFMFSAIYIGGFVTSIPSGWIVNKYQKPKILITIALFGSSVSCFLLPVITISSSYIGLSVIRFITGLFNTSLAWPPMNAMIARWIPPNERSTVIAIQTSGIQLASIIGMPLNAYLCRSNFLGGWPAIFYVHGTIGLFVCIIWFLFASNTAESSRFISSKEKVYVQQTLMSQNLGIHKDPTRKIPLIKIMTSPVVLTCWFCYLALSIVNTTLMTGMPTYYKEALYLSLANNGLFSAAPYMFQLISKIAFAVVADFMKSKTKLSTTVICKIFNTISFLGVGIFILACSFMDCNDANFAVVFISMANLFLAANTTGFQTALLCIAPAYIGILSALNGFPYNISAILTPLIIAGFTPQGTVEEWSHVFYLIVALSLASCVLFLIFGSAQIQSWAIIKNEENTGDNLKVQDCMVTYDNEKVTGNLENSETLHTNLNKEKYCVEKY